MKKIKINYFIDILMIFLFLIVAGSGIVLYFFLPSGERRAGWRSFLGIPRHSFSDIHELAGLLFLFLLLIHIILHLKWIVEMTKNFLKSG